jgi:hypothetical protein
VNIIFLFYSCNRNDFKREPCKLCPLKGCTISLGDNPDTFLIKHPDQSKYQFFIFILDNLFYISLFMS